MLITIVIVLAGLVTIAQLLMHINIKRLREQVVILEAHKEQASSVLQGLALSNMTTAELAILTAAKQEAILKHLGLKFADKASLDDETIQ